MAGGTHSLIGGDVAHVHGGQCWHILEKNIIKYAFFMNSYGILHTVQHCNRRLASATSLERYSLATASLQPVCTGKIRVSPEALE